MVAGHTQSTAIVKKAIAESGRTDPMPPTEQPADKKVMIDVLNSAPATDVDKTCPDQQTMAHQGRADADDGQAQSGELAHFGPDPAVRADARDHARQDRPESLTAALIFNRARRAASSKLQPDCAALT